MTTTDRHQIGPHERGRWRAGFHRAGVITLATLGASVALHWTWTKVQVQMPGLPDLRFVDAVAALLALTLIVVMLGLAWRAGAGPRDRT